ncbi:PTS sugar transporter subunit IIC [[Clostridium] innocuum]|nr:PTS sugar transporter subunit IIC [[Clostridium] innocuum]
MEVSMLQAFFIALFTWLGSQPTPFLLGTTGGFWTVGRPLLGGTIVGIILGDVQTGMMVGASISLIFLGVITPGGAVSTDVVFAGYLGTTIAMVSGTSAEAAVALSVPLGLIGAFTWNIWATVDVPFNHIADRKAEKGDIKGVWIWTVLVPQLLNFLFRFAPAFLVALYGQEIGGAISGFIPDWLNAALGNIGGLLPAIGMALLLKVLVNDWKVWGFFLIGFVMIAVLKMTLVPVTLVALSIALFTVYIKGEQPISTAEDEEDF